METKKRYRNILLLLLFLLLIVLLTVWITSCMMEKNREKGPSVTAVIKENTEEVADHSASGSIRIVINPVVEIIDDTMQNLGFCNYNENRFLQCKIKVGETYIYDSGLLPEGSELIGDFVDTGELKKGENEALAEIYSYTEEQLPIGQTNVKIILNLQ